MISARIFRLFRSLKFTIFLFVCLSVIFFLGLVIPQKDLLGWEMYLRWKAAHPALVAFLEFMRFTDIYTAPLTLVLWGLFSLNLIFVMSNRIPMIWRRYSKIDFIENAEQIKGEKNYTVIEGVSPPKANAVLSRMGYKVFLRENSIFAVRNRFSPLATIIFHLSFFLLLLGVVMTVYTRFTAEIALTVGETFEGRYSAMRPPKLGKVPVTVFTLQDVRPYYYKKNVPVDLKVTLDTKDGIKVIGINKPYNEGALSFVINDIDVAPLFVIKDSRGSEVDGAYVQLRGLSGGEDSFTMAGYHFKTVFYTDYSSTWKVSRASENLPQALKQTPSQPRGAQNREIVLPAFKISVFKEGYRTGEKTIKMGEYIEFDEFRLYFSALTYWVKFLVVKEYGLGIIYAGFAFMTTALIIRFFFYRRDLKGVVEDGRLCISGKTEFFPSLFSDEFGAIIERLKAG